MQWVDEALILDCGKYAENSAIVHVFSREHGRFSGVSKAALAARNLATYQAGNLVHASWKARLPEHMGTISCELVQSFAALAMADRLSLSALSACCALVKAMIPERDPHPALYDALRHVLLTIAHGERLEWQMAYARFELLLLTEVGVGLDLSECASTGVHDDLIYVSPKSGRAVSATAGQPYHDRLLALPAFLKQSEDTARDADIVHSLRLTGHFLETYWRSQHHKDLPLSRERLVRLLSGA